MPKDPKDPLEHPPLSPDPARYNEVFVQIIEESMPPSLLAIYERRTLERILQLDLERAINEGHGLDLDEIRANAEGGSWLGNRED